MKQKKWQIIRGVGIVFTLVVVWTVSVDQVSYLEKCPDCGYVRNYEQKRIFGYPVQQIERNYHTLVEESAQVLGVPCQHARLQHIRTQKLQGLFLPVGKTTGGTFVLGSNDPSRVDEIRAKVRQMASENPTLPEQFRTRVLLEHDSEYLRKFFLEIDKIKNVVTNNESSTNITFGELTNHFSNTQTNNQVQERK